MLSIIILLLIFFSNIKRFAHIFNKNKKYTYIIIMIIIISA